MDSFPHRPVPPTAPVLRPVASGHGEQHVDTDRTRCRVARLGVGGSRFRDEITSLLHSRLKIVGLIALVPSLLFLSKNVLLWELHTIVAGPSLICHAVATSMTFALTLFLWVGPNLSVRWLRTLELVLFGSTALFFGWQQFEAFSAGLLTGLAFTDQRIYLFRMVSAGMTLRWFFLIVLYGVFIPNTWRRCAAVSAGLALAALTLAVTGSLQGGHRDFEMAVAQGDMAIVLLTAVAIAIFGSHRLHLLQERAFEAQQLGQYQLKRKIGTGGMGEVYLAEHLLLRRPCALKLIHPNQAANQTNLQRFEREVRAMATLTHWNTVEIFDYGHAEDGTFYYVMEYLPGEDLESLVTRQGALPPGRVVFLLRQVCRALREAHGIGLLHRDIKPSNVIVGPRGGEHDVAKLLDFGLVQGTGLEGPADRLTLQGTVVGSPPFMSPEQGSGKAVDLRTDIYGVGAVAYYLLTGLPPFLRETAMQMLMAHAYEPVIPPTQVNPAVPADLQAVVLRCLEKEPAKRYPDASSLEKALAACACAAEWGEDEAARLWAAERASHVVRTETDTDANPRDERTITTAVAP